MDASARLVAFVATTNADRTRAFYGETLGLPLVSEDQFALVFESNGTTLRIARVQEVVVAPYTVLGWSVADIVAAVTDLAAKGVQFQHYPGMGQDELGIWTTPGGKVAWFKDPEGHTLSLSQSE